MRILFLTRSWHGTGGLQTFSRDLWREMHGHYKENALLCHPARPGVLSLISFAFRALVMGIRIGKCGHIHLGDASLCPLGALIHLLTGVRISVTAAGLDVIYKKAWYQWMLRCSLRFISTVCCVSHATAEKVRERGVDNARIVVIPNGIRTGHLPCRAGVSQAAPKLLSVGRLIPRKGVAWFIDQVMPILLLEFPTLTYLVAGDGPERRAIEDVIQTHDLATSVRLLGAVTERQKEDLYLESDLLIVPNVPVDGDMEGFGIVCIEASAHGLPVVAAKLEGISDAVQDRETGRFFEARNPHDAARIISQMIASPFDPQEVEQMTAMHYDWARIFPQYNDIFR